MPRLAADNFHRRITLHDTRHGRNRCQKRKHLQVGKAQTCDLLMAVSPRVTLAFCVGRPAQCQVGQRSTAVL
jgi:hypothetical protein